LFILCFFTWATPKVLTGLYKKINIISDRLSEIEIRLLSVGISKAITRQRELKNSQAKELIDFLQSHSLSYEFNYLVSFRLPQKTREYFYIIKILITTIFSEMT